MKKLPRFMRAPGAGKVDGLELENRYVSAEPLWAENVSEPIGVRV